MLATLRKRFDRDDEGFTLIELMVVVLIIAILLAIAIPTFLGARERAQDRAAQSNLRNAYTAAKSIYTDNETYAEATSAALEVAEPTLKFPGTTSADQKEIGTAVNATTFVGVSKSKSGKCFYIKEVVPASGAGTAAIGTTGTFYGNSSGTCTAATTSNVTGDNFGDALGAT